MKMFKSWSQKGKAKLSNTLSFLGNKIFPWISSMDAPETELTVPGADPTNMTLSMSENDRAGVSSRGTSGQHPEPSNHFSGELRVDMADGLDSVGIVEQDEELDLEAHFSSNDSSGAPVSGLRAHLNFRTPLPAPFILFGIKTNIALSIFNIKFILDMKLPGSAPSLPEGVLAAAAGIGLLTSALAIYLQVKNRRSGPAKVLSQMSVVSLVCSILVNLSTRFGFEQFGLANIGTTAMLFVFSVGMVIHAGRAAAVY